MKQLLKIYKDGEYLILTLGLAFFSFGLSASLGRTLWSIPLLLIVAVTALLGFVSWRLKLIPKGIQGRFEKSPWLLGLAAVVLSLGLIGLGLFVSVAGPLANHITAGFFKNIFLFAVAAVLVGSMLGSTRTQWSGWFQPLPILVGLGLVIVANKLFNVYGLATLAHLLSVYMVMLYATHAIFWNPRQNKKFFDLALSVFIPVVVLLLCRGMMQMIIRPYFQSGLVLNHNYTSIGLVLGVLVPLYFLRNRLPAWAMLPALALPLGLGTLFFGEVAAVYLLTLSYTVFVLSWLELEKYQSLNALAFFSFAVNYAGRQVFMDKSPIPANQRLILAGIVLAVLYGLYVWGLFKKDKAY